MKLDFKNMSKKRAALLICAAAAAVCAALNAFHPPRDISEKENRELKQFPKATLESVGSGEFMDDFEAYAADQFLWRDGVVSIKADAEKLLGKKGSNGVHFARDGYLILRPDKYNAENLDKNITAIKNINDRDELNVTLAVVPTAFEILKDKLPRNSYDNRTAECIRYARSKADEAGIPFCDVTDMLTAHNNEYIYYRGDHHQTALGSYYTYRALGAYLGYKPYDEDAFDREVLSKKFRGTTWSKASTHFSKKDIVEKFTLKDGSSQSVSFPLENREMDGLYSTERLEQKDKYAVYLDGNHALTVIHSGCGSGRKLAVLKDSYAHSLAPFLANHFDEIHLIDMRYYNDDIIRYFGENGISDVLALYNSDTFSNDTNLEKAGDFALNSDWSQAPPYGFLPMTEKVTDDYFADAAFLGDSLIAGFSYTTSLPAEFICRASINTENVHTDILKKTQRPVMQSLLDLEGISKYYIMIGINEVSFRPVDDYIAGYARVIDIIKEHNPSAVIYIQSVLPIAHDVESRTNITKAKIDAYNERLVQLAEEKKCYYLNVNGYLAEEDGYLRDGAAHDGIHIGSADHARWEDYLRVHAVKTGEAKKSAAVNIYSGGGSINMDSLAWEMLDGVPFADNMAPMNENVIAKAFGLSEGEVLGGTVYTGSGSTAEEFAAFETDTPEKAKDIAEKLRARVEARKGDFEGYKPAEMAKLSDPVIITDGCLAAMCVSDDNGAAETVFSHY